MSEDNLSLANEWCVAWSGSRQHRDHSNSYLYTTGIISKMSSNKKAARFKTKSEWHRALPSLRLSKLSPAKILEAAKLSLSKCLSFFKMIDRR